MIASVNKLVLLSDQQISEQEKQEIAVSKNELSKLTETVEVPLKELNDSYAKLKKVAQKLAICLGYERYPNDCSKIKDDPDFSLIFKYVDDAQILRLCAKTRDESIVKRLEKEKRRYFSNEEDDAAIQSGFERHGQKLGVMGVVQDPEFAETLENRTTKQILARRRALQLK